MQAQGGGARGRRAVALPENGSRPIGVDERKRWGTGDLRSGPLRCNIIAMGAILILLGIIVLFLLIVAGWVIGTYNGLVTLRNRFKNAFSQIDVQLKRRYDLIPNLVETAKGYLKHERETLEAVVKARGAALAASQRAASNPAASGAVKELVGAEAALGGALGRLMAVVEQYPDLKANQNMMQLTEELTSTENKVAFARQAYNDSVMVYNTECEKFPANIIAGMFGFTVAELFEVSGDAERQAPKVSFS